MARFGAFRDTRNLFIEYTDYKKPLTFDEWKEKSDNLKAGLLFVQFYNEITLAWSKADSRDFGDDAEGVTTILQYLQKHVSDNQYFRKDEPTKKANIEFRRANPDGFITVERHLIEENPRKFAPGYIYKVAYNCLYCVCGHDRKRDKDIMENEVSQFVMHEGKEFDVLETDKKAADWTTCPEVVATQLELEKEFWNLVEDEGQTTEKVMRYLLSNEKSDLRVANKQSLNYMLDPLRDVSVPVKDVDRIVNNLRERLLDSSIHSRCGSYISQFKSVRGIA